MAVVNIALRRSRTTASPAGALPVVLGTTVGEVDMTPSSSSVQSSVVAPNTGAVDVMGLVWQITAKGGDVRVKFGADPTALSTGASTLILAGTTREFGVTAPAEKVAVINDAST